MNLLSVPIFIEYNKVFEQIMAVLRLGTSDNASNAEKLIIWQELIKAQWEC